MLTKWFFQRDFADVNLFKLCASAASFRYPGISHGAQSTIFSAYALNTDFYQCSDWCQTNTETGYLNIKTQKMPLWFHYREGGKEKWYKYTNTDHKNYPNKYLKSISYNDGLFSPKAMFAFEVKAGGTGETEPTSEATLIANLPLIALRYNPHEDTGHGNEIYLTSTFKGTYDKPKVTDALYFNNVPLWMGFYGYWDFILQETKNKGVFDQHMFVVKCPALRPISQVTKQVYYPLVDMDFCSGRLPFDEYMSKEIKSHWYPTAERQTVTINNFVTAGPYMPKFEPTDKDSTWQLNYHYKFFLSGVVPKLQTQLLKTHQAETNILSPILCNRQYKLKTLKSCTQPHSSMTGTLEGASLHKQLLKECQKTSKLIHLSNLMAQSHQKKEKMHQRNPNTKPKARRDPRMSPLTLRRAYLPRRDRGPPALHPAAATAAVQAQKKPLQTPHSPEKITENKPATDRTFRVRPFKPGFEQDTERELAIAFCRPPRKYANDPPFYPWLPWTPLVHFNLNYRG